eukprot:SM000151S01490  [mRNA]  locus=s151:179004:180190:+ [translate_table: standard]
MQPSSQGSKGGNGDPNTTAEQSDTEQVEHWQKLRDAAAAGSIGPGTSSSTRRGDGLVEHAIVTSIVHYDTDTEVLDVASGLELPRRWANLTMCEGELDLGVMELLGVVSLAHLGCHHGGLDDLDARRAHAVSRRHLVVHLLHAAIERRVPVLLVHVVVARPALVPHPDAKVLDGRWSLLKNLQQHGSSKDIADAWPIRSCSRLTV